MLLAHPVILDDLVERYAAMALLAEDGTAEARERLDTLAHMLCTATGTADVDAALAAARHRLPGARPHDDTLRPGRHP